MRDADVVPVVLSEDEHEKILTSRILPAWTRDAVPQEQPVAVLVGGPPGSGNSTACQVLKAALDRRGGAVLIGRDLYKFVGALARTLQCRRRLSTPMRVARSAAPAGSSA